MFMKWLTVNSSLDRVNKGGEWRRITSILMCSILMLTSACQLLPNEEQEEVLPKITPPTISKKPEYIVARELWISKISASGKVMSEQEEAILFRLDKPIQRVLVKNGDNVKAGQVIAILDVDDMKRELRKEKLSLKMEEAQMKRILRQQGEMDPIDFETAKAKFEEFRQKIADLEKDVANATIKVPFAGRIANIKAKSGEIAKKNKPAATIVNTSRPVIALDVSGEDLKKVAPGMKVELDINSVNEKYKGKVKTLPVPSSNNNNDDHNRGLSNEDDKSEQDRVDKYVIVELSGSLPKSVGWGTPLSADIITQERKDVITVPPSTIHTFGSRKFVRVVDKNGNKREADVEVGEQDATKVEIKAGLEPGQKVVGK